MRVVGILAVTALIVLVVALFTGSTWAGFAVIALAALGIVLLVRDWRTDRLGVVAGRCGPAAADDAGTELAKGPLTPDEFSPDLSTDPDGPSSDARADQL
jgi:hypothetical protein